MTGSSPATVAGPRLTAQTVAVLAALRAGHTHGLAIIRYTGLQTGTVYPILARLQAHGWVTSTWDTTNPARSRRVYTFTDVGRQRSSTTTTASPASPPPRTRGDRQ